MANHEKDWWYEQVDLPCFMVLNKLKKVQDYTEDDAPVADAAPLTLYTPPVHHPPTPYKPGRGGKRQRLALAAPGYEAPLPEPDPKIQRGNDDLSVHDGTKWIKNRGGLELCPWHNAGQCERNAPGNKCPYDQNKTHQCDKCLKTGHGAWNCDPKRSQIKGAGPPGRAPGGGGGGRARGGGKGGGRGNKGGGQWWRK